MEHENRLKVCCYMIFYGLRWPSRVIHLEVHQEVDPSLGASCRRRGAPEDGLVEDEVVVLLGGAGGGGVFFFWRYSTVY